MKLSPMAVWGVLKEMRSAAAGLRPLVVTGALAPQLAKELARDGSPGAVRTGEPIQDAAALVHVLGGAPTEADEGVLRAAKRAKVPVIVVQTGAELFDVPYVLPTDVVACPPGSGFPIEEIARALASRVGDAGPGLAARLPVLRGAVCEALIDRFSRQNGVAAVAIFVPGADFPVLTLNQLRLVLRVAAAHGVEVDQSRLPEVLATLGAAVGFRAVARQLLGAVPVAGWLVKGAVAYAGTRALGQAADRYFAAASAQGTGSAGSGSGVAQHPGEDAVRSRS